MVHLTCGDETVKGVRTQGRLERSAVFHAAVPALPCGRSLTVRIGSREYVDAHKSAADTGKSKMKENDNDDGNAAKTADFRSVGILTQILLQAVLL